MKIKLGIDVDDCICNTVEMDYACAYYVNKKDKESEGNFDSTYFDVTKTFNFTQEESLQFYKDEKQYIIKNTSMYPKVFVKEVLHILKQKGFEINIISSRDNIFWNGDSKKYLTEWLNKYEIEYDKVFSNVLDKEKLCEQLNIDYLIEDNPIFVKNVNEKGIKTILIKQPYNKDYKHELNLFAENWLDLFSIFAKKFNFDDNIIFFKTVSDSNKI